jgi:alpha-beta hydrolase superfamily lysophospholipase
MERLLHFYSGAGLKLVGILETPQEAGQGIPCVVLCHGPTVGKDFLLPEVANWLVGAGYATFRFDCRGFGESEGPRRRLIPLEQVEDIRNAITFIKQQAFIDAERIGLFGAATGGANATYVAGVDYRVKCVVSVSAAGDCGRWFKSLHRYWEWVELVRRVEADRASRVMKGVSAEIDFNEVVVPDPVAIEYARARGRENQKRPMSLESTDALIQYRPESVAHLISPRAAMWLVAGEDTYVSVEESERMYALAGEPKKLVVIAGARHPDIYSGKGFEQMMTHTTAWLNAHLKGNPG